MVISIPEQSHAVSPVRVPERLSPDTMAPSQLESSSCPALVKFPCPSPVTLKYAYTGFPLTTLVDAISVACQQLSRRREGALVVIEQETGLQEYIDTGIVLNADPSAELLMTIFNKTTELHDGAVIVRGGQLAAAACVLPLSTRSLSDRQMGLRHRASLGISEVSDAVVVVVSEETGQVSIAHNGRIIRRQDPSRLNAILNAFLQDQPGVLSRN